MSIVMRTLSGIALGASLACFFPAQAQDNPLEEAGKACVYGSGQEAIDACSGLIALNSMPEMAEGREGRLQAVYLMRFQHYLSLGNVPLACADAKSAIAQGLPLKNIDEAKVLAFKNECDSKGY